MEIDPLRRGVENISHLFHEAFQEDGSCLCLCDTSVLTEVAILGTVTAC